MSKKGTVPYYRDKATQWKTGYTQACKTNRRLLDDNIRLGRHADALTGELELATGVIEELQNHNDRLRDQISAMEKHDVD